VTDFLESSPHRIRVLIVDDYASVRQAVATVLEAFPDLELVGEASEVAEALRLCARIRPDVVLMDISLPGIDGAPATRDILDYYPSSRVLATCTFQEEELMPEALKAGAVSCLLKNVSANELASAIRAAYATPVHGGHSGSSGEGGARNPQADRSSHRVCRTSVYSVGGRTI
jgi:DNA-binding NarL/FixJ family response regulator